MTDLSQREFNATGVNPCVFWLTDFGHQDGYVGVMKAVVMKALDKQASNRPVTMIDISHDIPAFDIRAGAWVLERLLPYAPNQSVFVCIVDPHVGSPQQMPLLVYCPQKSWVFLAPDNGLLTSVIHYLKLLALDWQACILDKLLLERLLGVATNRSVSATFHGRDIYSPLAAWALSTLIDAQPGLAKTDIEDCFTQDKDAHCQPVVFENWQAPHQIAYVDHFGNVITRLRPDDMPDLPQPGQQYLVTLSDGAFEFRWVTHYQEGHTHEVIGLWGSHGYLEWACPSGSAARFLQAQHGMTLALGQPFILETTELEQV
jgi:S-adenosyl-L-methionine hydrolase (adenosine-forming)